MKKLEADTPNCNCSICRNKLPFAFPTEIIEAAKNEDLVVFAGAGVSTESKQVFKFTLYEQLCDELGIANNQGIDFPSLVSKYCTQINGRQKFLQLLRYRFEYVHQYPELYSLATRFHKELAPFWMIKTIITTNWDDYFERECGAIPIVTPKDFAFYNMPDRKVFKIHGSINNYGSIVASKEDYDNCYKELKNGLIGSYLKTILATKTVLFVGYSFRDFNFNKIYSFLKKELHDVLPKSYIVTLDNPQDIKFKKFNSTIIKTDAAYFLSILRDHFIKNKFVVDDSSLDYVATARMFLIDYQKNFVLRNRNMIDYPGLLYTVAYQDGLRHGFDYLLYNSKQGKSCNVLEIYSMIQEYEHKIRPRYMKYRAYHDVAYIDGYIFGLYAIFINEFKNPREIPFLYIYGLGAIDNEKEFNKRLKNFEKEHKSAYALAKIILKRSGNNDRDIITSHRPFL